MVADIKTKNNEFSLCRVVAGFAWPWVSRNNPNIFDIDIKGYKLKWNSTTTNWVNSRNAIDEVGCIHTIQGYDLNYVGVIVGPELSYDPKTNRLVVDENKYEDRNGWRGITDPIELERYIINIYKTLMTRGMRGCCLRGRSSDACDSVYRHVFADRNAGISPQRQGRRSARPASSQDRLQSGSARDRGRQYAGFVRRRIADDFRDCP